MPLGRYRTTSQAAERLGTTPRYVAQLVERRRLTPATKLPGRTGAYLFEDEEIERYAEARKARAGTATGGAS